MFVRSIARSGSSGFTVILVAIYIFKVDSVKNSVCPKNCKVNEETLNCSSVYEKRQSRNIKEICQVNLRENFYSNSHCQKVCNKCKINQVLSSCSTRKLKNKYKNCLLKPETGLCRGYFVMYYFHPGSGECKTFVYGGCGGNANRFKDPLTCMMKCGMYAHHFPPSTSTCPSPN